MEIVEAPTPRAAQPGRVSAAVRRLVAPAPGEPWGALSDRGCGHVPWADPLVAVAR